MAAEFSPENPVYPFSRGPAHKGQIRFDPSESLKERIGDLFLPEKREIGIRATKLYLSSQYVLVAYKTPTGQYVGNQGQIADRLRKAVERPGAQAQHRLGREVLLATAEKGEREYLALKFAVHLHPLIREEIVRDELLHREPIIKNRSPSIGAVAVFEGSAIHKDEAREAAVQKLREFVVGGAPLEPNIEPHKQESLNPQAHVTNARFTFAPPH